MQNQLLIVLCVIDHFLDHSAAYGAGLNSRQGICSAQINAQFLGRLVLVAIQCILNIFSHLKVPLSICSPLQSVLLTGLGIIV